MRPLFSTTSPPRGFCKRRICYQGRVLLSLSSLGLLQQPGSFVILESEQVQPSLSDYYKDEPNPGYEPEKKREDRY